MRLRSVRPSSPSFLTLERVLMLVSLAHAVDEDAMDPHAHHDVEKAPEHNKLGQPLHRESASMTDEKASNISSAY